MARRRWSFWMPPEEHLMVRWAVARYRAWLTPAGRALVWAGLLGAVLSSPGTYVAAYLVPSLALSMLFAGWLLALLWRPRVVVERELPPPPSAGDRLSYRVRVRNLGRRPLRALAIGEGRLPFGLQWVPELEGGAAEVARLGPGEATRVGLALGCPERGVYRLPPLSVGSAFPSGLVRWPRRLAAGDELVVYPRFLSQREFELPVGRVYQPGGIPVCSGVGDSTEFQSTREYREGDRLRDVHWASYARTGRLVVKEYREEYFVRVGLLLDTELPRGAPAAALERRISLAAGIVDALARRDFILDVFAAGEDLYHFQAGRALARLENLLELLACVELAERVRLDVVEAKVMPHAARLSAVVLLLADWDPPRERLASLLRELGVAVRPVVIRSGPPSVAPPADVTVMPAGAAGEEVLT